MQKKNMISDNIEKHLRSGVYLIGAGPGAHDLITVRGAQILAKANIVFCDALIDPKMLQWCSQAEVVFVGKRCGKYSTSQIFINRQLTLAAKKYDVVVRLKGGDPLIFGRASEEIKALSEENIYFEVVPGITTALAACAELKQPPTERNISRTLKITTLPSHLNYEGQDTLIYYMGREQLPQIAHELIGKGYALTTPVCIMESVSLPDQRSFGAFLEDLLCFEKNPLFNEKKPVIVLVGNVYNKAAQQLTPLNPIFEKKNLYESLAS
jgi:uroporphyrin-III C-methyltransferase